MSRDSSVQEVPRVKPVATAAKARAATAKPRPAKPAPQATVTGAPRADNRAWERIRPVRASDEIVAQFRNALFEGHLGPGDPVGTEADLAEQFGVSRMSVREALRTLEAGGIVEVKRGAQGGARIARGDPNRFAEGLAVQLKLVGVNPVDALAAQLGLEWVAAQLAAYVATPAEIQEMERQIVLAEKAAGTSRFTEHSMAFHDAVAVASHNWAVITALHAIRELLRAEHHQPTRPERVERVLNSHREILAAIDKHDGEKAGQLMMRHIGTTRANVGENEPRLAGDFCA